MAPLPGQALIHPQFQAHFTPTITATMTATCVISRPISEPAGFDEIGGRSQYSPAMPVFEGPCRVQRPGAADHLVVDVGDRETKVSRYMVAVPVAAGFLYVGDLVTITTCPHDLPLVGVTLTTLDVAVDSIRWQTNLWCNQTPTAAR